MIKGGGTRGYCLIGKVSWMVFQLLFCVMDSRCFMRPVVFRADAKFLFKGFGKIQLVIVTDSRGNFLDRIVSVGQKVCCLMQTKFDQKFLHGNAQLFLERMV